MRVVRNTFRLKNINFILRNDSELDKEEKIKIKCYYSLLFDFWGNFSWEELLNK